MKMNSIQEDVDAVTAPGFRSQPQLARQFGLHCIPDIRRNPSFYTPSDCPPFKSVDLIRLLIHSNISEEGVVFDYMLAVIKLILRSVCHLPLPAFDLQILPHALLPRYTHTQTVRRPRGGVLLNLPETIYKSIESENFFSNFTHFTDFCLLLLNYYEAPSLPDIEAVQEYKRWKAYISRETTQAL